MRGRIHPAWTRSGNGNVTQVTRGSQNIVCRRVRGRVVGGSSSINAMVYCRGLPQDFDDWSALGNPGWSWRDVQPVYERFERPVDATGRASPNGQLFVSDVRRQLHPMEQ
eukprot:gene6044-7520_t